MPDAAALEQARALVAEVAGPGIVDDVQPDDDVLLAGVNSGDLIRLTLLLEERLGAELDADDLSELRTLAGIARFLERVGTAKEEAAWPG